MSTAIVLSDVHLDDTRPNREGKITRFMERRDKSSGSSNEPSTSAESARSMIDVTLRMKENDMFGEILQNPFSPSSYLFDYLFYSLLDLIPSIMFSLRS
jgi:vacuolar protein sorting-associated protein 13A/C